MNIETLENNKHQSIWVNNDFKNTIVFLSQLKINKNNSKILTEYFFNKYSDSPKDFNIFLQYYKIALMSNNENNVTQLAESYMNILSFLCERFWAYETKLELDDLCFSIIYPKDYKELETKLEKYKKKSKRHINQIYTIFNLKLSAYTWQIEVSGRYKNIYSIYKKCQKKQYLDALKLSDIFAFRIITLHNNPETCFDIVTILHDCFMPLPSRFKDYITVPKINGYQSIHTWLLDVIPELDLMIEVQVRTIEMHEISEHWVAAHYLYSRDKKASIKNRKERKLFDHMIHDTLEERHTYALTPVGDIIKLDNGATILDFAGKIHSKLRKIGKYALVNNTKQSMKYTIQKWDVIDIITQ